MKKRDTILNSSITLNFEEDEPEDRLSFSQKFFERATLTEARQSEELKQRNFTEKEFKEEQSKLQTQRRKKLQAFILVVAYVKYFVLSLAQITDDGSLQNQQLDLSSITVCFSMIFFGSVFDNTARHKQITIAIQSTLSVFFFAYGMQQIWFESSEVQFNFQMTITLLGPAVSILIYLQIFNWFSQYSVAIALGVLFAVRSVAIVIAIQMDQNQLIWLKYVMCSIMLLTITVVDIVWFKYYPMESGIFVNIQGRSFQDQLQIDQIQTYMINHPDQSQTFLELFYQDKDTSNKGVSLIQPFNYAATYLLLIGCTMRHVSLLCSIFFDNLLTSDIISSSNAQQLQMWFIVGFGISSVVSAVLFTYLFKRKFALTLVFYWSLNIIFQLYQIAIDYTAPNFDNEQDPIIPTFIIFIFLGMIGGLSHLLLMIVGPLMIAAKNRNAYEITMGGSMIAICNVVPYMLDVGLSSILLYFCIGLNEHYQRIILCTIFFFGAAPFLIDAKRDWNKQSAAAQDYFDNLYKQFGGIPANHQMAIDLRMEFFTKYVLDRRINDYKSSVEKDWMYVARREYRYDVNVRSLCDAAAAGLTASMIRMFMLKKFIWWPFAPVALFTYVYRSRQLFAFHNKKFFDMCNVGEQYEVGFARNVILRRCNKLLDREDF